MHVLIFKFPQGGGLAMITGAITKLPAVGLSGPNAMLVSAGERARCIRCNIILTICFSVQSRRSFEPMISTEALDRYTFNIVPERDVVPMLDDKAQNYQSTSNEDGYVGHCLSI